MRLRGDILSKLEQAKKQGDHRTVLRFTRLYAPLGLQVGFRGGFRVSWVGAAVHRCPSLATFAALLALGNKHEQATCFA